MRFQGGLVLAGVLPPKMTCFCCCTARICLRGLQSTGQTAAGGTTSVFLSCVLPEAKDLSCSSSNRHLPLACGWVSQTSSISSGWFLTGNQFGLQHLWSAGLLGAGSACYLQQTQHKLASVILLGVLGYHQPRQQ